MGLFSKRNLDKAKALAEKNKDKIASTVNKATDAIDKKTGGKHSDKLKKIDDAAKKYAGEPEATAADAAAADGVPTDGASTGVASTATTGEETAAERTAD